MTTAATLRALGLNPATCRLSVRQGDHNDTFYANVWSRDGQMRQLAHGRGVTRAAAIAALRLTSAAVA